MQALFFGVYVTTDVTSYLPQPFVAGPTTRS